MLTQRALWDWAVMVDLTTGTGLAVDERPDFGSGRVDDHGRVSARGQIVDCATAEHVGTGAGLGTRVGVIHPLRAGEQAGESDVGAKLVQGSGVTLPATMSGRT